MATCDRAAATWRFSRVGSCLACSAALISIVACGGSERSPTAPSTLTVTEVTVAGPATLTAIAEGAQFTATSRFSDGSTQDQTKTAAWASSDPKVVSVNASGVVTAVAGGRANVQATFRGVTGLRQVEVAFAPPTPNTDVSGRIENPETVADLIAYNQNIFIGFSTPVEGVIQRSTGIISRWELPIPVYVDPSIGGTNVAEALAYWQSVTGLSFTLLGVNAEPRIVVRAAPAEELNIAIGSGFVYRTYSDNRAQLGVVKIRTDFANCSSQCSGLYRHELGHAIGIFGHVAGGALMASPQVGTDASMREINMLVQLYRLPHGARIEPDGTWRVVR
jgi:hypothetical protein